MGVLSSMSSRRRPLYWYIIVIVVGFIINVAVSLLVVSFKRVVYVEEQHEAPLQPTDTPYESGVISY